MNEESNIFRDWQNSRRKSLEQRYGGVDICALFHAECREYGIRMRNCFPDKGAQTLRMPKIQDCCSSLHPRTPRQ